jgi:putative ABC transport system permease protein
VRTFRKAAEADPFLRTGSLLICRVDTASGLKGVREIPGVSEAALAWDLPMSGMRAAAQITMIGSVFPKENVEVNYVSPGFFQIAGAGRPHGRDFAESDVKGRAPVAIVNEQTASKYWNGNALGRQLRIGDELVSVVGVVQDHSRRSYREEIQPRVYFPIAQHGFEDLFLILKMRGGPADVLPRLRSVVSIIGAPQTLTTYTDSVLGQERLAAWCLSALAAVALVLSVVGLYGVAAYSVSQRTAEIGIRMALGGTTRRVIAAVLQPALIVAGVGVMAGTLLSMGATRLSASLFYGVARSDPVTWIMAAILLVWAVVIATAMPALRASQVEPAVALRGE